MNLLLLLCVFLMVMVAANASVDKGATGACQQGKTAEKRWANNRENSKGKGGGKAESKVRKGKGGGKAGSKGKGKGKSGGEARYVMYNSDPCSYEEEIAPFPSTLIEPSDDSLQSEKYSAQHMHSEVASKSSPKSSSDQTPAPPASFPSRSKSPETPSPWHATNLEAPVVTVPPSGIYAHHKGRKPTDSMNPNSEGATLVAEDTTAPPSRSPAIKSIMPATSIGAPLASVEPASTSGPKGVHPTESPLPTILSGPVIVGRPPLGPDLAGSMPSTEPASPKQIPSDSPAKAHPTETLTQTGSAGPMNVDSTLNPKVTAQPTTTAGSITRPTSPLNLSSSMPGIATRPSAAPAEGATSSASAPTPNPIPKVTAQPAATAGSSTRPTSPLNLSSSSMPGIATRPTAAPAEGACKTNENGVFGQVTSESIIVDFSYEVETSSGDVEIEIIPALEKAFNDQILPSLFGVECGVLAESVLRSALGVSARPDDSILRDTSCAMKDVDTNDCVVVRGGLTVFISTAIGREDENVIIAGVISALQRGMQNGDFNYVHKGMVRVTFVDIEEQNPAQGEKAKGSVRAADSPRKNGLAYGVVAGAAVCVIASVAFIYNGRRKETGDTETNLSGNTPQPDHVGI